MSFIQNFFTSRDNNANTETYLGQTDRLWYNPDTNTIRVSDGSTPGGLPVNLDIDANASINSLTANAITVNGNITVTGNISPAAVGKIGGVQPGPGANISNTGLLTIDTTGLPLSFGDFTANNNVLTVVNMDEDMVLQTQGNAEIQLVGNIGFYKPDGLPPNVANRYFEATSDGQISILVPTADPTAGAVKIIGSTSGNVQSPVNTGTMLHVTGQNNLVSRIYNDSVNNYSVWIGRRYNGTAMAPTPVLAGDSITRFGATTYTSAGTFTPLGVGRFNFIALEDQTATAQGSSCELSLTAIGANVPTTVATWTVANGMTGNVTGNLTGNTVTLSGNVTANNVTANTTVTTKIQRYTPHNIGDANLTIALDFSQGSVQYANLISTGNPTVTLSNLLPGQNVTLIITNNSGTNRQVTHGCSATNSTTGNPAQPVNTGRIGIFKYYSMDTTAANCKIGFE